MTVFHFKAVLIDQDQYQARYKMYLDFDGRKGWHGIAIVNKDDGKFSMESREYDLTPKMIKIESHCVSAIQHQFKKIKEFEGQVPKEIFFIA